MVLPDDLATALAVAGDRAGLFSRHVLWYAEVSSTNDVVATLADRGEPEGSVVIADAQSAGRGRHGRIWASPPGAGLYMSILMRPAAHAALRYNRGRRTTLAAPTTRAPDGRHS